MEMMWIRIMVLLAACMLPLSAEAMVRHYKFNVGALIAVLLSCHAKHYRIKFAKLMVLEPHERRNHMKQHMSRCANSSLRKACILMFSHSTIIVFLKIFVHMGILKFEVGF